MSKFLEDDTKAIHAVAAQMWDAIQQVRTRGPKSVVSFENGLVITIERQRDRQYLTATTSVRVYEGTMPHVFCVLLWAELRTELRVYNPEGRLEVLNERDLEIALQAIELYNSTPVRRLRTNAALLAD